MLKASIKASNSEYAKSTIYKFYKIFYSEILKYKNNSITSQTIEPRKTLTKAAIAFIVFLFISVAFVLLSEALKKHAKQSF